MNQEKAGFTLRQMVYAAMFGALTALGAFIVVPFQPVPITLQTFFTGLSGLLLGSRTAALSQIVYVLLGLLGLPVFSGGKAGLGVLLGPTGGYLIGFIVGAWLIGKISEQRHQAELAWSIIALLLGNLLIYAFGLLQLCLVGQISLWKALLSGMIFFIPGDIVKMLAAILLSKRLKQYLDV